MKTFLQRCVYVASLVSVAFAPVPSLAALPNAVDGAPLPSLAPMLEQVTPAVVNIATRGSVRVQSPMSLDPFFRRYFDVPEYQLTQSLGSGVIVDAGRGLILTNHHVVATAHEITVTLRDGRKLSAVPKGSDPATDIAVIQVAAENLVAAPIADSNALRVGDFVVAIGNPFGLGGTVTSGIVSAIGRSGLGIHQFENLIQTDASINPGNSGGALVNLRGELVGINSAIFAPNGGNVGIGFAIPSNMSRRVMNELLSYGEVRRGLLGVVVQDLTRDIAAAFGIRGRGGVIIAGIRPGSPAGDAGLQAGDIVTRINGRPIRNADDMRNRIGLLSPGDTVEMRGLRKGDPFALEVRLGDGSSQREAVVPLAAATTE